MGRIMRDSDWAYIAGFFDGDGSIDIQRRSSTSTVIRLNWYQSEPYTLVLEEIQRILEQHYIKSYYALNNKSGCYRVRVNAKQDVKYVLEEMFPYLIVKRNRCKQALDLIKSKTKLSMHYPMDWDYVAGFFDAEGHISSSMCRGYKVFQLKFTQSLENSYVLDKIKEFLEFNDIFITESVIVNPDFPDSPSRQIGVSAGWINWVLQQMQPWLIVKGRKAKEAIMYLSKIEKQKEEFGWNYRKEQTKLINSRREVVT